MRISHNLAVDFYRARKDKVYLDDEIVADDLTSSPEQLTEVHFDQQQLRRAILKLHGEQQQGFQLSYLYRMGFQDEDESK